jgi:hypothetical protein
MLLVFEYKNVDNLLNKFYRIRAYYKKLIVKKEVLSLVANQVSEWTEWHITKISHSAWPDLLSKAKSR